jgi:uracil-DNA glycosylase family 4
MESNLVFGEGNIDCAVMFIGEAPGVNEDRLKSDRSSGAADNCSTA